MSFLFSLLAPLAHCASLVVPKRKDLWCFGAWFGQKYADNSRYLFEEASGTPGIDAVWISKRADIVASLRSRGLKAQHAYSPKGLWTQVRAGTFVCTVNSKDFYFATVTRRSKVIQLWHGSPLKRIGFDAEMTLIKRSIAWARAQVTDRYETLISPAPIFDPLMASAFGIAPERLVRGGYPRNDGLFVNAGRRAEIRRHLGVGEGDSLVLYLPTHRDEGRSCEVLAKAIARLTELESRLAEKRIVVVAKPHFYDAPLLPEFRGRNLHVVHDIGFDLYETLGASDGLVTDYSSVFFDFDILGKPIYFLAPDIAWYRDQGRGMYFPYDVFAREFSVDVDSLVEALGGPGHLREGVTLNVDREGQYSRKLLDKLRVGNA